MEIGIVSDSHSNPWGQASIIEYLREMGINKENTYNLGDITGMFPEVIPTIEMAKAECQLTLIGNHDAVLIDCFEDDSKRDERIKAIKLNRKELEEKSRYDLIDWISSFSIDHLKRGVYLVHNSPFGAKDSKSKRYMLARISESLRDPSNPMYDQNNSNLISLSQYPRQVIVRGHAHAPSIQRVKRGLSNPEENMAEYISMEKGRTLLEIDIDPDFTYLVTVGSACGANTIFTKDIDLDYRPSGGIISYDQKREEGKITLFRTTKNYAFHKFIESVRNNHKWDNLPEAQKQIGYLEREVFFN
ncbi:metallophosphoesterase family protein [Candidatus Pacearchaeota archaeon]|nr:metallophosphoesterase family protein [Candidatus Pacearchaeota archaeon]